MWMCACVIQPHGCNKVRVCACTCIFTWQVPATVRLHLYLQHHVPVNPSYHLSDRGVLYTERIM